MTDETLRADELPSDPCECTKRHEHTGLAAQPASIDAATERVIEAAWAVVRSPWDRHRIRELRLSLEALARARLAEGSETKPKRERIDWSNVVVDEGDESP